MGIPYLGHTVYSSIVTKNYISNQSTDRSASVQAFLDPKYKGQLNMENSVRGFHAEGQLNHSLHPAQGNSRLNEEEESDIRKLMEK